MRGSAREERGGPTISRAGRWAGWFGRKRAFFIGRRGEDGQARVTSSLLHLNSARARARAYRRPFFDRNDDNTSLCASVRARAHTGFWLFFSRAFAGAGGGRTRASFRKSRGTLFILPALL